MHLQHLAPDLLVQQVAPFALQQVAPFARTRTTTTDRQTCTPCFAKHILECGVIVLHVLEEPLLGELWVFQELSIRLDISLLEVVGLGLITCEEVRVVKEVHLLSGEVRSVTTVLKKWKKCRRFRMNEKMRKKKGMEDSRLKRYAHHVMTMRWRAQVKLEPHFRVQLPPSPPECPPSKNNSRVNGHSG